SAFQVKSLWRPSILPGQKFARSRKTCSRVAFSISPLLGAGRGGGFLFADAGIMPLEINNATTISRYTAFTQMHRGARQLWLCCAANLAPRYDCNPGDVPRMTG